MATARPFTLSRRPPAVASRQLRSRVVITATAASSSGGAKKHKVVFLGTPEVAAGVLGRLLEASRHPDSSFEVALVVSQPGKPRGRGNRAVAQPSPVEALAREQGLTDDAITCPAKANEPAFLERLIALQPDLAVTAAYGNMLPQRFLDIPRYGTLNVHPSLLPRYRGAAPVQRAVEDGVPETGVSVAFTVLACDAGPVLAQQRVAVGPDEQAPELLTRLFGLGTELLLQRLPDVWAGRAQALAVAQDEAQVLHAAKLRREESQLDFASTPAHVLHNRVRAFAGWPGTSGTFLVTDEASGASESIDVKIIKTRAPSASTPAASAPAGREVVWEGDAMRVPCASGSVLEVLQVQPPTKKAMAARDFRNGLRGKKLLLPTEPQA
ncbi:hypothetical protein HYH03_016569 [Edaphochlamys debaryana]|uniref:Methionyl-tRNA formyltransferase, mitochondrial n=1 Tax=Edaphochlamys debaryana TaxID=47281 RepID=A0A836BPZ8_9CHLO|nr:hypothetical protein HYH03_016569 [Edaphochlamys debaryana]|eukprot:KAG2484615.1 hypothetical protein HYH03_016569 [Edaphochlamys debaryana]